jgi:hypothetical protein
LLCKAKDKKALPFYLAKDKKALPISLYLYKFFISSEITPKVISPVALQRKGPRGKGFLRKLGSLLDKLIST